MNLRSVPVGSVISGERHRQDMGDILALAENIAEVGLLHPIGVTEDRKLVFGERRLRAVRDVLMWRKIDAVILDIDRIVDAEYAENEMRKGFTQSERLAIRETIATKREGYQGGEDLDNSPSTDDAAKQAGFTGRKEAERVATVVDQGVPELVEAMDKEEVSVSAAAEVAKLPEDEQRAAVAGGKKDVAAAARLARENTRGAQQAREEAPVAVDHPAVDVIEDAATARARAPGQIFQEERGAVRSLVRVAREFEVVAGSCGFCGVVAEEARAVWRDIEESLAQGAEHG